MTKHMLSETHALFADLIDSAVAVGKMSRTSNAIVPNEKMFDKTL